MSFDSKKFLFQVNKKAWLLAIMVSMVILFRFFVNKFFPISSPLINFFNSDDFIIVMTALLVSVFFVKVGFSYLDMGENNKSLKYEIDSKLMEEVFFRIFNKEKKYLKSILQDSIGQDEKNDLVAIVKEKIENEGVQLYFNDLKNSVKKEIEQYAFQQKMLLTLERIEFERQRLSKRGNLNLLIGMAMSIGGLLVLGFAVLNAPPNLTLEKLMIYVLPRGLFVILIEVFAYFFLKLYKQSLEDIKYYQNELTNIEAKYLAVQMAKESDNQRLLVDLLKEMIKTERNFILQRGQTTVDLEKEKLSVASSNNAFKVVTDFLKAKKE